MKNMKSLLRLIGALALTTGATASVVACPPANVTPEKIEDKYAALLKLNTIVEKLNDDYTKVENNADKINPDFASFLKSDNTASNDDAVAFLEELGFKRDSDKKYSDEDAKAIKKLKLNINKDENKISLVLNTQKDDFLAKSSFTFEIKKDDKVLKTYTWETEGTNLKFPDKVKELIINKADITKNILKLDSDTKFVSGGKTSEFILTLTTEPENKKLSNLIKTLNLKKELTWSSDANGANKIEEFSGTTKNFLTIKFGDVVVQSNIDCGNAVVSNP